MKNVIYNLKPNYSFYGITEDYGYLINYRDSFKISGKIYVAILLLLDGIKSDNDIALSLKNRHTLAEVFFAFLQLAKHGYLVPVTDKIDSYKKTIFKLDEFSHEKLAFFQLDYSFCVISKNNKIKNLILTQLKKMGLDTTNKKKDVIFLLVCENFIDTTSIRLFKDLQEKNKLFFPIQFELAEVLAGPLYNKCNNCACFKCGELQLRHNLPIHSFVHNLHTVEVNHGPRINPPNTIMKQLCWFILTSLYQEIERDDYSFLYVLANDSRMAEHVIRKRPQCEYCGNKNLSKHTMLKPIQLKEGAKKLNISGGYRVVSPDETWQRYKHLISDKTGIICDIEPFNEKNHPLRPVWHAGYYVTTSGLNYCEQELFIKKSFGKGYTWQQSRVSALCEAVERYSSLYQGDEPIIYGTYNELKTKSNIIHPRYLLNFSDCQYINRESTHADKAQEVPCEFDENVLIPWTYAWSFLSRQHYLIPFTYCYSYAPFDANNMCPFNPNGHAAGNTIEEAILQGVLELIERDAVAIWWYNRLVKTGIDILSFNDPYFTAVYEHYQQHGWDIWLLDVTTDLAIPVAVAIGYSQKCNGFIIGMGCHLDFHLAVQRAITEMHQVFTPLENKSLWKLDEFENPDYLFPAHTATNIKASQYATPDTVYIKEDIEFCQKRLKDKNLDILAINYTRMDIQLSTVKVIIPGLRHFWRRFGPGRLYDVPVDMDWLDRSYKENELNPVTLTV